MGLGQRQRTGVFALHGLACGFFDFGEIFFPVFAGAAGFFVWLGFDSAQLDAADFAGDGFGEFGEFDAATTRRRFEEVDRARAFESEQKDDSSQPTNFGDGDKILHELSAANTQATDGGEYENPHHA
jgi:hypothetical protein